MPIRDVLQARKTGPRCARLVIMLTRMNFEFFVALRYLKAKRRQAAISIITVISVLGVTAGVCALVISLAINNGFREELESRLLGATANINLVRKENDGIRNFDQLSSRLAPLPHVVATAPSLYEEVLVSNGSRAQGVVSEGRRTRAGSEGGHPPAAFA